MAIEVRIPTILRTYTGGEKAVTGSGASLAELIDDLEANHPGLRERLLEDKDGSDDLRRAMDDPLRHRDLLVRISGYNAYFVELNRNMQLELIDRTEHGLGEG